ncbi:hypothetical protein ACVDFE_27520 [Lentzea chajnantorensis]
MFGGGLSLRRLRRRCAARVRELPMPDPFDVRALCALVAGQRDRPITLLPMTGRHGVLGLWVATDDSDLIFYEEATTRPHQDHIILHELCHLLCDHYAAPLPAANLMPHLDPDMVRSVLERTGYTAVEEQEAELLASLILQQAGHPTAPPAEGLAHRISEALNWPDPR